MPLASDLVIKSHDPKRNRMIWLGAVAACVVAGFFIYLLGQAKGGYDARESKSEIKRLNEENSSVKRSNQKLRKQMAELETAQTIDQSSYVTLQSTVKDLEGKLATQGKELRFYQQILSPEDKVEGIHLLNPEVQKMPNSEEFQLDMVIYQFNRNIREIKGAVDLSITGEQNGVAQTYALQNLFVEDNGVKPIFKFRYFQSYELRFVIPEGYKPQSLNIEINPSIRGYKPITKQIEWATLLSSNAAAVDAAANNG